MNPHRVGQLGLYFCQRCAEHFSHRLTTLEKMQGDIALLGLGIDEVRGSDPQSVLLIATGQHDSLFTDPGTQCGYQPAPKQHTRRDQNGQIRSGDPQHESPPAPEVNRRLINGERQVEKAGVEHHEDQQAHRQKFVPDSPDSPEMFHPPSTQAVHTEKRDKDAHTITGETQCPERCLIAVRSGGFNKQDDEHEQRPERRPHGDGQPPGVDETRGAL